MKTNMMKLTILSLSVLAGVLCQIVNENAGHKVIEPTSKVGYGKMYYGTFGPDLLICDTLDKVTFCKIAD